MNVLCHAFRLEPGLPRSTPLTVTSRTPPRAERSSSLLARGVPLAADPPQYVYTKLPSLRPRLLAAATKDAQVRARVLVAASGAKLGKLRGVDVGVFQVSSPNSTDVSDYGVYDTTTLRKDVTAVVNVTFALS